VTGGYVARRPGVTHYGRYFYGDYCAGQIWSVSAASPTSAVTLERDTSLNITSFGKDNIGRLYAVHHGGSVYRISGT
jgi:hypothetical protein